jgi:hypothetical protein
MAYMGAGEVDIGFWWENLRESDHLKYVGIDERYCCIGS